METEEIDRTIIRVPTLTRQLPSTIFETEGVELKVGLLNQAAPQNGKIYLRIILLNINIF